MTEKICNGSISTSIQVKQLEYLSGENAYSIFFNANQDLFNVRYCRWTLNATDEMFMLPSWIWNHKISRRWTLRHNFSGVIQWQCKKKHSIITIQSIMLQGNYKFLINICYHKSWWLWINLHEVNNMKKKIVWQVSKNKESSWLNIKWLV